MFQTFDSTTRPDDGPPRLAALRQEITAASLDAWVVPRADAWQGEYVAPGDERLAWLTGFTGSAGWAAVTADAAAVFADGRYRVQARAQCAADFDIVPIPDVTLKSWLLDALPKGARIGLDPWLHTAKARDNLATALQDAGRTLVMQDNLVDRIWTDRPGRPTAPYFAQDPALAGETSKAKRQRLATGTPILITAPDSIAWLLNIRGADIPRNPVPQAFAVLNADASVDLYCDAGKADDLAAHLGPDVRPQGIGTLEGVLRGWDGPITLDPASCPAILADWLAEASVQHGTDPCALPRARKTAAELQGTRDAHHRDAVAMVRFLAWLDRTAPSGGLTEIDVVTALEGFRAETNALRDISFDTICGAGPHGAIVHYRVTRETNAPVTPGQLLLVDSGGQYIDGTTDITRTLAIGPVPAGATGPYTALLRGVIAISRARFPKGVTGRDLDALARQFLWSEGLDYDHGTGHGVGSYLCVHEGPQAISRRNTIALEPGMILSNEPGYYREGAFGIRIENLIAVQPAPPLPGADAREMLAFETLTYVPFDRRLIDAAALAPAERDWIDSYHAEVRQRLSPHLGPEEAAWLRAATAPLPT